MPLRPGRAKSLRRIEEFRTLNLLFAGMINLVDEMTRLTIATPLLIAAFSGILFLSDPLQAQPAAPQRPDSLYRDALRRQATLAEDFWRGARKTQASEALLDSARTSFTLPGGSSPSYTTLTSYSYDASGRVLQVLDDAGPSAPRQRFRYAHADQQEGAARCIREWQESPQSPWKPVEMSLLALDGQGRTRESALYGWSDSLGAWLPSRRLTYDLSPATPGASLEEIEYEGVRGEWIPKRRHLFFGNIGAELYVWLPSPGTWQLQRGYSLLNDAQGLLLEYAERTYDESSQNYAAYRSRYFYEGALLVRIEGERAVLASAEEAPAWQPAYRSINEYDSAGRLVNNENLYYEGIWKPDSRSTQRLDSAGRLRESVLYLGLGQAWGAYKRSLFAYDSLGVDRVLIQQQKAPQDSLWQNAERQRTKVDAWQQITFQETEFWSVDEWVRQQQRFFAYDAYPAYTSYTQFRYLLWDPLEARWEKYAYEEIRYDPLIQLVVGGARYFYQDGDSICNPCYEYAFGPEKRLEFMTLEQADGSRQETRNYYSERELSAPALGPLRFLFENPLPPGSPIQVLGKGRDALHRLRLLDLQGRELMQAEVFGSSLIQLPAGLKAGLYLLQVQEEGRWQGSQKLLIR
jgi:hypothetical protein